MSTIAVGWKGEVVGELELELCGVTLAVREWVPLGDEGWGGEVSLRAGERGGAEFVDGVAAQLGLAIGKGRGKPKALPGLAGSIVVFSHPPHTHALGAKLGLIDPRDESLHEVYFDVEDECAAFRTKDAESDRDVLALLAYGLRDGHWTARVRVEKRAPVIETFDDLIAVLTSNRDEDYQALVEGVERHRGRFVAFVPKLLKALATARREPTSVKRALLLSSGCSMLELLERPEAAEEYALGLSDQDEWVRRNMLLTIESACDSRRSDWKAFLDQPAVAKELVHGLDVFVSRYVLVGDPFEIERAIAVRKRLAER